MSRDLKRSMEVDSCSWYTLLSSWLCSKRARGIRKKNAWIIKSGLGRASYILDRIWLRFGSVGMVLLAREVVELPVVLFKAGSVELPLVTLVEAWPISGEVSCLTLSISGSAPCQIV